MIRSLGLASDLMVMKGSAEVEDFETHSVLRTPKEPTFWFGNCVIFDTCPDDPSGQIAAFDAAFPQALHKVILWDDPQMPHLPGHTALEALGFEIERCDVLTLTADPRPQPTPDGVVLRQITTDADWAQVVALQTDIGVEDGHDRPRHLPYVTKRFDTIRAQQDIAHCAWFGAFDGDLLVGDLGIMTDDRVARYRSVETRASHRGRGICPALVTHALGWARQHAPQATAVIVAEEDSAAGRIYRRCGFAMTETTTAAVVKGY